MMTMIGTPSAHRVRGTKKLLVAGCLLLGAGFLSKLDTPGMIATNVLSRFSRVPAPVMQYQGVAAGPAAYGRGPSVATGSGPMVQIQGETLRTWAFKSPAVEKVQVELGTEGRPLEATVEVWNAAGNTPFQARVYSEDGEIRPISAVLEVPRGPSTVAVRNIGQMEFPMSALVTEEFAMGPSGEHQDAAQYIQGGALKTYPLDPTVDAVEVLLTTGGMPMNARIEILQGPDTNKQVIELYSENGMDRPFFCTFATPFSGNVVRVLNTGPMEYPLTASIVPARV
jgi:hypothetical protein